MIRKDHAWIFYHIDVIRRSDQAVHFLRKSIASVCERNFIPGLYPQTARQIIIQPETGLIGIESLPFKYIHAGDLIRLDKIGLNRDISFFPDPGTLECQYPFRILYIGNLLNRFQVLQGEILSGQPQILQIEIPVIAVRTVRHPVHIGVNSGKCQRSNQNHQEYCDEL